MNRLKNELIGSWNLLSYIEVPLDGVDSLFPLGKSPKGTMFYTSDNKISLQISAEEREQFADDDRFSTDILSLASSARTYIAFSGTYRIQSKLPIISYRITTSLFPNWEGKDIDRSFDLEGDVLYVKTVKPILSNGVLVNAYMTWQRQLKEEIGSRRDKFMELTKKTSFV